METVALPLVGRRVEVAALRTVLDEVAGGRGQVVFVEGEPGIGKTRLLHEAVGHARQRGFRVFKGAADEGRGDHPFGLLAEALAFDPTSPDAARAGAGHLLTDDAEPPAAGLSDLGFRVTEAVLEVVEVLAGQGPVALALDDLQWADAPTLRAVRALGRAAPHLPLALLLTLRPQPRSSDLADALREIARGARHFVLEPLSDDDAGVLAAAVAGVPAGPALSLDISAASGNPLLVVELAQGPGGPTERERQGPSGPAEREEQGPSGPAERETQGPRGPAERGDDARPESAEHGLDLPPATVERVVLARLHALPDPIRALLGAAAVLGRRFDPAELSALTGIPSAEVGAALRQAESASIVVDAGVRPEFRHELVREAVYRDLPDSQRRALHREAARRGSPARVAEHLLAGTEPGDAGAVAGLVDVAQRLAGAAPLTAVRLLERARALTPATDRGGAADAITAELAPLLVQVGRGAEAERLTRELLAGRPPSALEGRVRRALGEVLWTKGWLEASVGELEAAAAVDGMPATDRLEATALAANLRLFLGDPGTARDRADWALAEAGRLGNDFAACLALQTLALVADAGAHVDEAVARARQATALAERSTEARVGHLHAHLSLGLVLLDADRLDEAEAVLQEGRRRSEQRGTVAWLPLYHSALALRSLLIGSLDDGLAEVAAGLAVADEVGTRLYVPLLHGMAAWVALQRDEIDVARARMDAASTEFLRTLSESWHAEAGEGVASAEARWPLEWGLWVTALIHEAEGDADQAGAVLEDAWSLAGPLRYFLGHRIISPDLVRLTGRRSDRRLAEDVVRTLAEGARRAGTASAAAAALRVAGLLEDDPDLLVAAAETYGRAPQLMELAHTLEDAGRSLAGRGRTKEAAGQLEQALELFDTAGASRPSARIRRLLDSLGLGPPHPARTRPTGGWDSLTPTELKVAALVAEGLTNRQIGERLFVSRRTVETHVAHSFAKLGLSTRAQLAAEVARRRG